MFITCPKHLCLKMDQDYSREMHFFGGFTHVYVCVRVHAHVYVYVYVHVYVYIYIHI